MIRELWKEVFLLKLTQDQYRSVWDSSRTADSAVEVFKERFKEELKKDEPITVNERLTPRAQ